MTDAEIKRRDPPLDVELPASLHPVLRRVFAARGIRTAADLDISLDGLHRTELLAGVDAAVDLLVAAITETRRILIVADFDADGATSCAVAIRALTAMGAHNVEFLVPNRFEFGYGLTPAIVDLAQIRRPDFTRHRG